MAVNSSGYKRKERNSARRARRPVVFLAAEGKNKTETLYFRDFGQDVNRIFRFAPGNHTDPVNMVNELKRFLDENDFSPDIGDKAYCLVDSDVDPAKNEQIAKAEASAGRAGIEIVLSVPCFEIWFLCHFVFSTKSYASGAEVVAELQKHIPRYGKSTPGVYEEVKKRTSAAIGTAVRLERYCRENGYAVHTTECMPSTDVYRIVSNCIKADGKAY